MKQWLVLVGIVGAAFGAQAAAVGAGEFRDINLHVEPDIKVDGKRIINGVQALQSNQQGFIAWLKKNTEEYISDLNALGQAIEKIEQERKEAADKKAAAQAAAQAALEAKQKREREEAEAEERRKAAEVVAAELKARQVREAAEKEATEKAEAERQEQARVAREAEAAAKAEKELFDTRMREAAIKEAQVKSLDGKKDEQGYVIENIDGYNNLKKIINAMAAEGYVFSKSDIEFMNIAMQARFNSGFGCPPEYTVRQCLTSTSKDKYTRILRIFNLVLDKLQQGVIQINHSGLQVLLKELANKVKIFVTKNVEYNLFFRNDGGMGDDLQKEPTIDSLEGLANSLS